MGSAQAARAGGWPGAGILSTDMDSRASAARRGGGAGQTRIRRTGGSNPDRASGRVKSKTGDAPRQKKRPGANKTAVATVLAETDLTPPFDLNPGLNLGLNHTKIPAEQT